MISLGEIAENIFSGITPKAGGDAYTDSNGIWFIKSGSLSNDGTVTIDETSLIKEEIHNGLMKSSQLKKDDVLIAIVGATIGKVGLYSFDEEANINQAIAAVRLKKGFLPEFVISYLLSNVGQTYLEYLKRPVARANINLQEVSEIKIPNFSIEKQKKFIEIFNKNREKRNKKLQQADELLKDIHNDFIAALKIRLPKFENKLCVAVQLKNLVEDKIISTDYYHSERMSFIRLIKSRVNFSVKKLSEIVDFCRDIVASVEDYENYLGLAGVESQTGELSGISEEVNGQAFKFEKHDILYCRLRPYLNKVICTEKEGICSTEFYVMRIKNSKEILPEFLTAVMRSNLILMQTKHMMTGNTHPRISNDDVKNLYIPIPDISLQKDICTQLQKKRQQAKKLKLEAEKEWADAKAQFEKELMGE